MEGQVEKDLVTIHGRLCHLRQVLGHTQKEVAVKLGITASAYTKLENGDSKLTVEHLLRISSFFEVPPDIFIRGIGKITQDDDYFEDFIKFIDPKKSLVDYFNQRKSKAGA